MEKPILVKRKKERVLPELVKRKVSHVRVASKQETGFAIYYSNGSEYNFLENSKTLDVALKLVDSKLEVGNPKHPNLFSTFNYRIVDKSNGKIVWERNN